VVDIQLLPTDDKIEMKELLQKYIIEERREVILQNYHNAINDADEGKLLFSDNAGELIKILDSGC
jgi:hypothetical protein